MILNSFLIFGSCVIVFEFCWRMFTPCWFVEGHQSLEISSAEWPAGIYVIEALTNNGIARSRVLVQH